MMKEKIENLTKAINAFEETIKANIEAIKTAKSEVKLLAKAHESVLLVKTITGCGETAKFIKEDILQIESAINEFENGITLNKSLIKETKAKIAKLEKMQKEYEALQLETSQAEVKTDEEKNEQETVNTGV